MRVTTHWSMAIVAALWMVGCEEEGDGHDHTDGHGHDTDEHTHADTDDTDTHHDTDDGHDHGTGDLDQHIHGMEYWKDTHEVVIGTHEGVHRTEAGATELVELHGEGDFMGFVQDPFDPNRYWGSGHWAAGGFGNWGFIESTDGGETWEEITLNGVVDFHAMAVGHDQPGAVVGTFSGDLYFSANAGRDWDTFGGVGSPTGLEIEDASGPVVLVATSAGIARMAAPAMNADTVVSASVTGFDRLPDGYAYGTEDGRIHICDLDLADCTTVDGPPGGAMKHILQSESDPNDMHVLTNASQVFHTEDGGLDWTMVIEGE